MRIGIFARVFERTNVEAVLDAVVSYGIQDIQFNMICADLPSMPASVPEETVRRIRRALDERAINVASLSGTYNMIHPDPAVRDEGLNSLRVLAKAAKPLGANLLTLCTGTRNADYMWRNHADNATPEAWADLLVSIEAALKIAEENDVILGVEPEVSNVVNSPQKARQLLDTMASPHLKIVMDGANVFPTGTLGRQYEILDTAFELLSDDIVLAHAKDISHDGEAGHEAAGTGLLDYGHYVKLIRQSPYDGPLVLHSLTEEQVPACVAYVQAALIQ